MGDVINIEARRGHQTAVEFAYRAIKAMILRGELTPGERIEQDVIADTLGLSRMPIRAALQKLGVEGLVSIHHYRGATVRPFSLRELEELYLVRQELEGLALREAISHITPQILAELEMICAEADAEVQKDHWPGVLSNNQRFHFTLYEVAQRPVLLEMLVNVWERNSRYRNLFNVASERLREAQVEHRQILEHLRSGNAQAAERTLWEHNEKGRITILGLVEAQMQRFHTK